MKDKVAFFCTDCGNETPKWSGRCPACHEWNTIVEQPREKSRPGHSKTRSKRSSSSTRGANGTKTSPTGKDMQGASAAKLSDYDLSNELRFGTGLSEFDRVLGGGAVVGSLVLIGGSPGIGKSTLLLQLSGLVGASKKTLYVTGEESGRQLKMRAARLGIKEEFVYVLAETEISDILDASEELSPDILIIDSIQTLYNPDLSSSPGSVAQVKDCTMSLLRLSKDFGITVFLVGHINKEGALAGPKVLEHMVDCVLYFEGERGVNYRILRAAKNRFGSTNEIGVFEMVDSGLIEVPNPSEILLAGRPSMTPGTCVTCVIEGTRPLLAEIQALVAPTSANMPRRNSNGIEYNRAMMLLAVLQQRGGMQVGGCDTYINVIGGLSIDDTGADLATILALSSSYKNKPLRPDIAVFGEVGLTGELRQVSQISQRLSEISRMGFTACVLPKNTKKPPSAPQGLELIFVKNISQAISLTMP